MRKVVNLFLLILVTAIYLAVFFKFFSSSPRVTDQLINSEEIIPLPEKENLVEKFELELSPRDPFLEDVKEKKVFTSPRKLPTQTITAKPIQNMDWPVVNYLGFLELKSSSPIVVLRIDNKIYRFKKGEIHKNISIGRILDDGIEIIFHGEKKIIKKSG